MEPLLNFEFLSKAPTKFEKKLSLYESPQTVYLKNDTDLKVLSCKLSNNKYITSTQIRNSEIVAFIAVLVFNLLSRKVLFINRKDNRNC